MYVDEVAPAMAVPVVIDIGWVYLPPLVPEDVSVVMEYHWYAYDPDPPDALAVRVKDCPIPTGFGAEETATLRACTDGLDARLPAGASTMRTMRAAKIMATGAARNFIHSPCP